MIKFVSVFLVCTFAVSSFAGGNEDMKALLEKFQHDAQICLNQTGISHEQLYEISMLDVIPKEKGQGCFLSCVAKSFNLMDANNKVTKDAVNKLMQPIVTQWKADSHHDENIINKIVETINKCIDEQTEEKDECTAGIKAIECIITNGKKAGILRGPHA